MKTSNKATTTSASSATTSATSALPLHASRRLLADIDGLSVKLGQETVLRDVSLCIHSGEFLGLIGPNGAGKTTLLKATLGLLPAAKGKVSLARRNAIAYIPQRSAMHDSQVPMSVLEVVKLGSRGDNARALQALESVRMAGSAQRRIADLSGGQQQRVAIAKALASSPDMLVLDEPTTGIDERSQNEFYDLLRTLQRQDIAIVMVSHDIDAVLKLVTRVVCINGGILYDGAPEHFEADKFLPNFYKAQHRMLHHHHGDSHA